MNNETCAYCQEGDLVDKFGIKICELTTSKVYLFMEQSHKGRVVIAHKEHVSEMIALTDADRDAFFSDIALVARALHKAFNPVKVNYGAYGDTGQHLHFHLVPKYKDEFEWGSVFEMNPGKVYLTDNEYDELILRIKENLKS